jgi:hypothetical protein
VRVLRRNTAVGTIDANRSVVVEYVYKEGVLDPVNSPTCNFKCADLRSAYRGPRGKPAVGVKLDTQLARMEQRVGGWPKLIKPGLGVVAARVLGWVPPAV